MLKCFASEYSRLCTSLQNNLEEQRLKQCFGSCIKIEVYIIDEKFQYVQFPFLCNEETNGGALFSALQCMTQCRVNSQVYLAFTFAFNVVATRSQLDCSTTFLH